MTTRPSTLSLAWVPALLAVLAAPSPGQVTATAVAVGDITCDPLQGPGIRAGTNVSQGWSIAGRRVIDNWPWSSSTASATSQLSIAQGAGGVVAMLSQRCEATCSGHNCLASSSAGVNRVRITLRSAVPTRGALVVQVFSQIGLLWRSAIEGPSPVAEVLLLDPAGVAAPEVLCRYDRMGSVASSERVVTVGPGGLTLEIAGRAEVRSGLAGSRAQQMISASFLPNRYPRIEPQGVPCGPELETVMEVRKVGTGWVPYLRLDAFGIPANRPAAAFVFGASDPGTRIPPTNCLLRTDLLASVFRPVSGAGQASLELPIPASAFGATLRAQFLSGRTQAGAPDWQTSQGYQVSIR